MVVAAGAQSDADRKTCETAKAGEWDQSFIDTCSRAIAAAGDAQVKSQLLVRRALGYRALRQLNRALPDNDAAIAANPQSAPAYRDRALTLLLLHKFELAVQDCEKIIVIDGGAAPGANAALIRVASLDLSRCGSFNALVGHNDRAFVLLDQAVQLDPNLSDNLIARCSLRRRTGRLAEALEDCNRAVQLNPNGFFGASERSMVYLQLGRLPEAKADAEAAVKKGKLFIFVNDRMAQILTAMGDPKGAARAAKQGQIGTNPTIGAMLGIDPDQERKGSY